jgi:lysozyme
MAEELVPATQKPEWRHTSAHGRKFIAGWEGTILHAYKDIVGVWTWGTGHARKGNEPIPASLTAEEADALFASDLIRFEDALNLAGLTLGQNEFDALVSWLFNCGVGALAGSSVLRCLRTGDRAGVPAALALWCKAGGRTNQGLLNRRRSEGQLFATPDAAAVHELSDADRALALAMVDRTIADWSRGQPIHPHDEESSLLPDEPNS